MTGAWSARTSATPPRSWQVGGCGYAYAVEYLELGLGDAEERRSIEGDSNEVGYHGNAILSRAPLERPALLRLEASGGWFDGQRGEQRIGGRMAVLATVAMGGRDVVSRVRSP